MDIKFIITSNAINGITKVETNCANNTIAADVLWQLSEKFRAGDIDPETFSFIQ